MSLPRTKTKPSFAFGSAASHAVNASAADEFRVGGKQCQSPSSNDAAACSGNCSIRVPQCSKASNRRANPTGNEERSSTSLTDRRERAGRSAQCIDGGADPIRASERQVRTGLFRRRDVREAFAPRPGARAPSRLDQFVPPAEQLARRRPRIEVEGRGPEPLGARSRDLPPIDRDPPDGGYIRPSEPEHRLDMVEQTQRPDDLLIDDGAS